VAVFPVGRFSGGEPVRDSAYWGSTVSVVRVHVVAWRGRGGSGRVVTKAVQSADLADCSIQ
jgi:hypothetical protein